MTTEKAAEQAPPSSASQRWLTCNGRQLRNMARAGLASLEQNHQKVNELNVFPVPDGDTGTNMLLTMRAAYKRIQDSDEQHVGKVARELSQGALMGARGNSGVILSQIWRGLARGLEGQAHFDVELLAEALQEAADTAYKGVMRPVEGTILTVAREGAEEAADAANKSRDLRFLLERVLERCEQALARTPEQLAVLKQAGVVDAGGQGLVYILAGMLRYVHGEIEVAAEQPAVKPVSAQAKAAPAGGLEYPYDVQYILLGQNLDVEEFRADIDAMGDSTVVVGNDNTIKVHVHVKDPGVPISYGIKQGSLVDVVVENMQMQMEAIIEGEDQSAPRTPLAGSDDPKIEEGQIGVVVVAAGDGLAEIFRSLGAAGIVNGGQSNNPSTEEIFQVVSRLPTERVVILPNNKNIIMAAEAAGELSEKEVAVVPTRTAPQGISAILALDHNQELDAVREAMASASRQVASGEIATATRTVVLDDIAVAEGQIIGVVEGRLRVASSDMDQVVNRVLEEMDVAERELLSIYYGAEVSESEADELAERVTARYPDLEIEVLSGGQSIYHFILGAE